MYASSVGSNEANNRPTTPTTTGRQIQGQSGSSSSTSSSTLPSRNHRSPNEHTPLLTIQVNTPAPSGVGGVASFFRRNSKEAETPGSTTSSTYVPVPVQFKLYAVRWYVLGLFSIMTLFNNMLCYTFASVHRISHDYYHGEQGDISYIRSGPFGLGMSTLVSCYFITYILLSFPSSWLIERYSFKVGVLVGSWLQAIGCFIRVCGTPSTGEGEDASAFHELYAYLFSGSNSGLLPVASHGPHGSLSLVLIGQFVISTGQAFFINPAPLLAANWFGVDERTLATTIAVNANTLGIAVAYLLGPAIVEHVEDLPRYVFLCFVLTTLTALMTTIYFPSRPKTPPSHSQVMEPPDIDAEFTSPPVRNNMTATSDGSVNGLNGEDGNEEIKTGGTMFSYGTTSSSSTSPSVLASSSISSTSPLDDLIIHRHVSPAPIVTLATDTKIEDIPPCLEPDCEEEDELVVCRADECVAETGEAGIASDATNGLNANNETVGSIQHQHHGLSHPRPQRISPNRPANSSLTVGAFSQHVHSPHPHDPSTPSLTSGHAHLKPHHHHHDQRPKSSGEIAIEQHLASLPVTPCSFVVHETLVEERVREKNASRLITSWRMFKRMFQARGFGHTLLVFGVAEAVINALSAFMNQIVEPLGYTSMVFIGYVVCAFIGMIMVGSAVIGYIVDRRKSFKFWIILSLIGCSFGLLYLIHVGPYGVAHIWASILILGFWLGPVQPLSIESAVEVTFPAPESSVMAVQQILGNVFSTALFPLIVLFRQPETHSMEPSLYFMFVCLLLTALTYFTFKGKYRRLLHEKEKEHAHHMLHRRLHEEAKRQREQERARLIQQLNSNANESGIVVGQA